MLGQTTVAELTPAEMVSKVDDPSEQISVDHTAGKTSQVPVPDAEVQVAPQDPKLQTEKDLSKSASGAASLKQQIQRMPSPVAAASGYRQTPIEPVSRLPILGFWLVFCVGAFLILYGDQYAPSMPTISLAETHALLYMAAQTTVVTAVLASLHSDVFPVGSVGG